MATITSIMIILNETSLGMFYFTIAMILRETILMSSMLLNVEVWTNITKSEINKLEMVEKIMIRQFIGSDRDWTSHPSGCSIS